MKFDMEATHFDKAGKAVLDEFDKEFIW